jgi:hypothetical protein
MLVITVQTGHHPSSWNDIQDATNLNNYPFYWLVGKIFAKNL